MRTSKPDKDGGMGKRGELKEIDSIAIIKAEDEVTAGDTVRL